MGQGSFSGGKLLPLLLERHRTEGAGATEVLSRAFSVEMVIRVHADLAQFAVPFLSPGRGVGDETLDSVAAHAPVSAVYLAEPVPSLTDGGFRDAVDSRGKFEGVVIPVWGCSSAVPV